MDAPAIEYARLDDGTTLACWAIGEGPPLLHLPQSLFTHTEMAWRISAFAWWFEELAKKQRLIHWDPRGQGLSSGDLMETFNDQGEAEILGVARYFGVDRFALLVIGNNAPSALAFAARHPDRVSALVVWEGTASIARYAEEAAFTAARPLADRDFHQFIDMSWSQWLGNSVSPDEHARYVELAEASFNRGTWTEYGAAAQSLDVTDELASIQCPTMIVHRRGFKVFGDRLAREMAAGISGSQLVPLDGDSFYPFIGDKEEARRRVQGFLDEHLAERQGQISQGFRAILFTDVVGSTPTLVQLGDAKFREVMRDHDAVLSALVQEHGGRVIKTIGDAFMVEFALPSAAVACAIAMQRGIQAQFADTDVPIRLRIGINAGEPIVDDADPHGLSVNIAKRLESAAPENGILIADGVKQLLAGKDFDFTDQGEVTLKGLDEPVRAWSVGWTE